MAVIPDVLTLTKQLLSFDTINPPGNERECAYFIGELLKPFGFLIDYYEFKDRRTTLVARYESVKGQDLLCFTGHLDLVPLGTASWKKDPFRGDIHGGKLYGRGSSDMKSGVAAMIVASLKQIEISPTQSNMILLFTAGEETCCEGAYHLSETGSDLGNVGAIVVGEPTSNEPMIGHKGSIRYDITTRGKTAHASMPELGDNAIHKAAVVIRKLQEFDFKISPHPLLGSPTLNIGRIKGGININSVPDQTVLGIDIRTIPGQDHPDVWQGLCDMLGDDVEIDLIEKAIGIASDANHPWIQNVYDVIERIAGKRPVPSVVPYFTDASVLKPFLNDIPALILGPGEASMAHQTDEFCYISRITEAEKIYFSIAEAWGKEL